MIKKKMGRQDDREEEEEDCNDKEEEEKDCEEEKDKMQKTIILFCFCNWNSFCFFRIMPRGQ